jgi:hypothetical protein
MEGVTGEVEQIRFPKRTVIQFDDDQVLFGRNLADRMPRFIFVLRM